MYPESTRALAVEAIGAGFTVREAAELAGCSRSAVEAWARTTRYGAAGRGSGRPPRPVQEIVRIPCAVGKVRRIA